MPSKPRHHDNQSRSWPKKLNKVPLDFWYHTCPTACCARAYSRNQPRATILLVGSGCLWDLHGSLPALPLC
eukprot:2600869-Amphidinium_carterae.1